MIWQVLASSIISRSSYCRLSFTWYSVLTRGVVIGMISIRAPNSLLRGNNTVNTRRVFARETPGYPGENLTKNFSRRSAVTARVLHAHSSRLLAHDHVAGPRTNDWLLWVLPRSSGIDFLAIASDEKRKREESSGCCFGFTIAFDLTNHLSIKTREFIDCDLIVSDDLLEEKKGNSSESRQTTRSSELR